MNWFIHGRLGHFYMAEAGEGGDPSTLAAPAAEPAPGSVLSTGNTGTDFIPEKYRTNKEDGSLDLEASSRKVAEAYKHLETRMGSGDAPPKTHEEYAPKIEVEGFNWDEFKADESTQSFLKGAHAKGLNNDQVEYVIGEYLKAAPGLIGGAAVLTQQDCTAALKAVWGDDQSIRANVSASYRAAEAFASQGDAPGNFNALMTKYGNDPDFIAFTANIGKELKEDRAINGGAQVSEADFAVKTAELRQQLQDLPAHDPKRKGIQAQLDGMYNQKYNQPKTRF
ncbi:hypothetical protein [Pseudomonas sp. CCI3.1]|uniref:hypothetical protein n=1 Tax=Pseudomonas sp. CCI3.1 TaxID=3048618 RepID=UPI002AB5C162|nr:MULTISPECIES: hypothetical protein [unclassified Pseudomonas]MDY7581194.1 hypothetical protein [Pseudomonas sp. CCI3.1]MEB0069969.1 hypothetical protein [Pseudomonas sp. CCI3.1]MEB0073015.1 hypothetical protein [Pseudomonas sp. CCI1.4]